MSKALGTEDGLGALGPLPAPAPWPMALQLLEAMTDQAVVPDVICLNAAISASHWPVALHLLRCMGQKRLRPTRTSYNAAISSCADGSEWQRALLLLARCRPDAVGFGSAMVALEREALWPLALHLLAASEKRSACDAVCFHNALTVCSAAKRWSGSAWASWSRWASCASGPRWRPAIKVCRASRIGDSLFACCRTCVN
ncbi:unnamed protein product [Effrenium voratum]|nr:unnamed protein product [Effrenium voratum]